MQSVRKIIERYGSILRMVGNNGLEPQKGLCRTKISYLKVTFILLETVSCLIGNSAAVLLIDCC